MCENRNSNLVAIYSKNFSAFKYKSKNQSIDEKKRRSKSLFRNKKNFLLAPTYFT